MRTYFAALVVLLGVAGACSSDSAPRRFGSIKFDSASVTLVTDDTLLVAATVLDDRGAQMFVPVTYVSADTTIAKVGGTGRIVGVAPGATRITATSEAHSLDLPVTVVRPTAKQVSLPADTGSLLLDQSMSLAPTITDVRGRTVRLPITYASSDPLVASVDPDGRVRADSLGTATITVRADTARTTFRVQVLPQFRVMTTGDIETCGITNRATTYCWGAKALGIQALNCAQFGLPCMLTPVEMDNGRKYAAISAGDMHVCAVDVSGIAYCWGNDWYGQIGNGVSGDVDAVTPQPVGGGGETLRFTSITAGRFHTCAIATTGDSYCWGDDQYGELGAGATASETCMGTVNPCSTRPLKVAGGHTFVALAASDRETCGRTATGELYCWGVASGASDVCTPTLGTGCTRTPLVQSNGTLYADFVMGDVHQCGQLAAGTLECWGANYFGEFGNGTEMTVSATPVPGGGGMTFAQVVSRKTGVCGLTSDGAAYCWGQSAYNVPTGGRDSANVLSPVRVGTLTFTRLWSGSSGETTCGLSSAGRAYCWGDDRFGQYGNGTTGVGMMPTAVAPLP